MPENLRITTAVPTGDSVIKPNAPLQSPQVDAVDPSRVNQPNTKDQKSDSQAMVLLLNRESVFGEFIQQLKDVPSLSLTLEKLLFDLAGRETHLLKILPKDSLLRLLLAGLPVSKEDMLESLQSQQSDSTRFTSQLFRLLDRLAEGSGDDTFSLYLADFLKAFDGYESIGSTLQAIFGNLDNIEKQLTAPYAKQLRDARENLQSSPERDAAAALKSGAEETGGQADNVHGEAEADLATLKKAFFPFWGITSQNPATTEKSAKTSRCCCTTYPF